MPCCNCHCSPCTCHTTEIRVPAPEARVYLMPGDGDCCPLKGWFETLGVTTWTPPAADETTQIAVCDATKYPVGICVKISDGTNTAVLKVTGWNKDRNAIYALGYNNAENVGGTMSGNINSFPLALCPLETQEGGTVCDRDYMVTAEAFVMPTAITSGGGTVKLVFDKPQTLQLGMSIYVLGAGFMEVSVPPSGDVRRLRHRVLRLQFRHLRQRRGGHDHPRRCRRVPAGPTGRLRRRTPKRQRRSSATPTAPPGSTAPSPAPAPMPT
jgi:hypothetical protein